MFIPTAIYPKGTHTNHTHIQVKWRFTNHTELFLDWQKRNQEKNPSIHPGDRRIIISARFHQDSQISCAAQHATSSTLCTMRWTRTWSSPCATTSSPRPTTRTWLETSCSPTPRPTCTPGCCSLAAAVSKVGFEIGWHTRTCWDTHGWHFDTTQLGKAQVWVMR